LVSMIVGQLTKDALIEQVDSSLIDPSYDAMLSTHFLKSSLLV
jgi:hypothetical protein